MDFSTIKQIVIPEGIVKKIEDGDGNIIWQKPASKVLQSITLSGQTTSLDRGSAFSFGGTVIAHYNDSSTADVTADTTFSGYNMATAGTYTVTASYTENGVTQTATYSLTVNKAYSTIWSGSAWAKRTTSGDKNVYSRNPTYVFYTLPATYTQFRFTFTISWGSVPSNSRKFYNNTSTVSSLTSPVVINNVKVPTGYFSNTLLGIGYKNSGGGNNYY